MYEAIGKAAKQFDIIEGDKKRRNGRTVLVNHFLAMLMGWAQGKLARSCAINVRASSPAEA